MASPSATPRRTGLVTFAGVMLVLAAALNLIDGIAALAGDDQYLVDELLFGDLTAWGIWWLCVGALLLFTGVMVLRRSVWGVVFGVTLAGINAMTQLLFIGAYPAWALTAMVIDGLIIAALTTGADEFAG